MQTALLMGSFNPVHNGHLAIARYVLDRQLAGEVWWVVSPWNPLKDAGELAPFSDRVEMVRLAIEGDPRMRLCTIEQELPLPSYTIQTLRALRERHPDRRFVILAGSDIADQLPRWREPEALQQLASFLFYPRNRGVASAPMADAPQWPIESTSLRHQIRLGHLPSTSMPAPVCDYITRHNLYAMKTIQELSALIQRQPDQAKHHFERGELYYRNNEFGKAMNDFNRALELDPAYTAARQMREMTESIIQFRNTDIYNP